jgi:flagellar basal-body rod modification protein FlgD
MPSTAKSANGSSSSGGNSLQSLNSSDFIQFLITELQNQDPMNPTSSDAMLQQLSEIGQLQSSTNLDTDLTGMVQQNQVSAASSMLGKQVQGTDQNSNAVQGIVSAVNVTTNGVNLSLTNGSTVSLANVTSITSAPVTTSGSGSTAGATTPTSSGSGSTGS